MSDPQDIQERISRRAHEIWEREGHPDGRHDEHWAQAEAEIRAEDRAGTAVKPSRKAAAKGTRAAAEGLSAVAAGTKAAGKAAPKAAKPPAAKSAAAGKPAEPKAARGSRKDNGKGAAAR
ncbi:membrane protein involved in colicin uptake [Azospirillum agricola]|uniref:DUF2934 domain-containing protein n=1 Tax=Azospirillum agricola TaxID=1720247 RepID=UPI001AE57747|nr:DUF2934 domain-containing protein [Azospirillum agricola]MBP2230561.1 membrane protein involved in colicin uptake [Azospirillum agricola]